MRTGVLWTLVVWMVGMPLSLGYGVERTPAMSDRELIEVLAELKAGQQALHQRFEDLRADMNARFEQVDKRFEQVDKRFEQVDKRFEQVDKRLDQMITLFLGIIAAFVGIVAATIGFAIWDRRTALRPALDRAEKVEGVLKAYAREEPRLAEILERAGML